jgi:hypothetical protein
MSECKAAKRTCFRYGKAGHHAMSVGVRLWFASTVESQSYQYPMSGIEESESGWEGVFLEWVGARFSR